MFFGISSSATIFGENNEDRFGCQELLMMKIRILFFTPKKQLRQ